MLCDFDIGTDSFLQQSLEYWCIRVNGIDEGESQRRQRTNE